MLWRIKHDVSRASLFAKHEKPTNTHETLGQTRKAHQYLRNAQQNTKCSAKYEMPTKNHEMLCKTRKAHQYPQNAQQNAKCPPKPTKCSAKHEMPNNTHEMPRPNTKCLTKPRPHPRPLSHRERGACFIKNKKPHQNPRKASAKHHTPKPPRCTQSRISTIKPCFSRVMRLFFLEWC